MQPIVSHIARNVLQAIAEQHNDGISGTTLLFPDNTRRIAMGGVPPRMRQ
jgi:hypothetical protein